jgi:ribosomal protein L11 methyltransferase
VGQEDVRGLTGPPYWELRVPVSDEVSEALTNLAWELGALGVVEDTVLRAFYPPDVSPEPLAARVAEYLAGLRALGYAIEGPPPAVEPLADADWAEAWKEHFRPIEVGTRLLIAPPWNVPSTARLVVVIEPGRAFGTGHHGSTAGCLRLLERCCERADGRPVRIERVLDIGTGSGILAIAAAKLGAASVLALDIDPDAVGSARANAARNGVADQVECMLGDIERDPLEPRWARPSGPPGKPAGVAGGSPPFPLVLANLLPQAHARLTRRYAELVAPGGALVVGGVPTADAGGLAARLEPHGFRVEGAAEIEGWVSLALTRS